MFCYKCGAENDDNSLFCSKCGTKIARTDYNNTAGINCESEKDKILQVNRKNSDIRSFVLTAVVLVSAICLCFYYLRDTRNERYIFTIENEQGNILMDGGIDTAKTGQMAVKNGGTDYTIEVYLNKNGRTEYQYVTESNIGNTLYYCLDGEVIASYVVTDLITNGRITFYESNLESADQLAESLQNTVL